MPIRKENNYAFIDSQNVNLAIRQQGWQLDFGKFRVHLQEKYGVSKAFLFIGFVPKNQNLYTFLQTAGYIIIFKPTIEYESESGERTFKGNVDAELVLHTMIQYENFNQAVIVTGDGDFYCLVDHLTTHDKLLRLLVPNAKRYSRLLKPFAPNRIDFMNNLRRKLEKLEPETEKGPPK